MLTGICSFLGGLRFRPAIALARGFRQRHHTIMLAVKTVIGKTETILAAAAAEHTMLPKVSTLSWANQHRRQAAKLVVAPA